MSCLVLSRGNPTSRPGRRGGSRAHAQSSTPPQNMEPQACPYLDTVERKRLDFDMDRICSVTLTAHNVYACLTCGLFFAGRGRATPAYAHALSAGHHVWVGVTPPEGAATAGGVSSGWRPRF